MAETIKINENTYRIEDGHVRFYLFIGNKKAALLTRIPIIYRGMRHLRNST